MALMSHFTAFSSASRQYWLPILTSLPISKYRHIGNIFFADTDTADTEKCADISDTDTGIGPSLHDIQGIMSFFVNFRRPLHIGTIQEWESLQQWRYLLQSGFIHIYMRLWVIMGWLGLQHRWGSTALSLWGEGILLCSVLWYCLRSWKQTVLSCTLGLVLLYSRYI